MSKWASILYVPPKTAYRSATAILDNLRNCPARHPLIVFSEVDWGWPGQIVLRGSPECVKGKTYDDGRPNPFAINNMVFLTAMRIAVAQELTHLLYLEADCRVRDGWDDAIFNEYFTFGHPTIVAGTLATYNPCNWSRAAAKRWEALVASNVKKNVPIATYGWVGAAQKHPSCVFANGALSVLDVGWMQKFFDLSNTERLAPNLPAWDMAIGLKLWETFAEQAYDVTGMLTCIFSSYGDVLTTEAERLEWLRNGTYKAVHQIKSEVKP